ncbi:MAG TPA: AMP-binding protein, partial [Solirubrobacteraceae bacterium]
MLATDGCSHWLPDASGPIPLRPELTTSLLLDEAAERWPGHDALVYAAYDEDGLNLRWSYPELRRRSRDVGRALLAAGLARGDRVALWATNVA